MKKFLELVSLEQWREIKELYADNCKIIILKTSPICTISFVAERIFNNWFSALPESINLTCIKIDVIKSRNISMQIAEEFNVEHQSPQVIWLTTDLKVKWHASHHRITEHSLNMQLPESD